MSNLYDYAKKELGLLNPDNDEAQTWVNEHILGLVKLFADGGHSGMSAAYTVSLLERLLRYKPLSPLTGEEDEWGAEESYNGVYLQQNKRLFSVFRENHDNATAYDIDTKVYSDDGGESWFSRGGSREPITFPYSPPLKPEKIYVYGEVKDEE